MTTMSSPSPSIDNLIPPPQVYLIWLAVASVFVYVMYSYDKKKAEAGEWRVAESKLLLGTLASPVGAFAGMVIPWHKVRKPTFWAALAVSTGFHLFILLKSLKHI